MGLLSLGTPLPWPEVKKHADHVREHGIIQFLNIWKRNKDKARDELLWGDEASRSVRPCRVGVNAFRSSILWSM